MFEYRLLLSAILAILGLSMTACATSGSAKYTNTSMYTEAATYDMLAPEEQSLYTRLGGKPAIVAVVDDFVANVAADKRINGFFANANIPRLKTKLVEQICAGTGGPCTYTGGDMKTVHADMGITQAHFNALVEDLIKSLNTFKVPQREQKELLAVLGPMQKDIVTR